MPPPALALLAGLGLVSGAVAFIARRRAHKDAQAELQAALDEAEGEVRSLLLERSAKAGLDSLALEAAETQLLARSREVAACKEQVATAQQAAEASEAAFAVERTGMRGWQRKLEHENAELFENMRLLKEQIKQEVVARCSLPQRLSQAGEVAHDARARSASAHSDGPFKDVDAPTAAESSEIVTMSDNIAELRSRAVEAERVAAELERKEESSLDMFAGMVAELHFEREKANELAEGLRDAQATIEKLQATGKVMYAERIAVERAGLRATERLRRANAVYHEHVEELGGELREAESGINERDAALRQCEATTQGLTASREELTAAVENGQQHIGSLLAEQERLQDQICRLEFRTKLREAQLAEVTLERDELRMSGTSQRW